MFTIVRGQEWVQSNGDGDRDWDRCCRNMVGMGTGIAGMGSNTVGMVGDADNLLSPCSSL